MTTMNWQDALSEFGLDFQVEKRPVRALISAGESTEIPNLYGIVRTDTMQPLSGVGVNERYRCIQTQSYADIGNAICGGLGAEFVNGGVFRDGKMVYLQAKLPDVIRIRDTDDVLEKLLTFVTSHDGTLAFMLMPLAWRIFCSNQKNALNREARDGIKIRHTRAAEGRLDAADEKILEVMNAYRAFEVKCNFLADSAFNDIQMHAAMRRAFNVSDEKADEDIPTRTQDNMDVVLTNFASGSGIDAGNRGTAWAAYNALTEYADHQRKTNQGTDRFENNLLGTGAGFKHRALKAVEDILAGR